MAKNKSTLPPDGAFRLPGGGVVTFDLNKVTRKQYTDFARGKMTDDQDNALLAKVTGLRVAQIENLTQPEFRRLVRAFYKKAMEPLADPN